MKPTVFQFLLISTLTLASAAASHAATKSVLETVRTTGILKCGINREEPEYSYEDAHGNRAAFDKDICRAVAVAAIGPNAKVEVIPYPDEPASFKALRSGAVDLVATATPLLAYRPAQNGEAGLGFGPVVFYDSQGLLALGSLNATSAKDLKGKKICFIGGTQIEINLWGWAKRENFDFIPFPFREQGEMEAALATSNCAAVSADLTQLAGLGDVFARHDKRLTVLPEVIAKDPLAPAYRSNDLQWAAVVDATINALIQAEESGVTQANIDSFKQSETPEIQTLTGTGRGAGLGRLLGLDPEWAARAIRSVGNYGEIFDRDLGKDSPLKLPRSLNAQWTQGGLLYASPLRIE
jgi:general L-amino acid transport system substrate-binding protein